jgi:hypothetical protein
MGLAMKHPCNVSEQVELVSKLLAGSCHENIYAGDSFFSS